MTFAMTFTHHDDGESFTVALEGEDLITADHGQHGWAGMTAVRDAMLKVAEAAGWHVHVYGDPCI